MPVRRLTHQRSDGEPYQRRAEVEAQIEATADLPESELLLRAAIVGEADPYYLRDETLFYHLRELSRAGRSDSCEELWRQLIARCSAYSRTTLRSLSPHDAEDVFQQVMSLLVRLLGSLGDEGDYCEVSFRQFLVSRLRDGYRKADTERLRGRLNARLDESWEDETAPHSLRPSDRADRFAWSEAESDRRLLGAGALQELESKFESDPRPYRAFLLQVFEGRAVGPRAKPGTIANLYDVSERTVNNWTHKVEAFLVDWRKRNLK